MKAIEKVSVTDLVVKEIKEMCFSGTIEVGEKLPTEKALCEALKVGRSTVREALRVLQAMGIVEMRPGTGAFLRSKSEREPSGIAEWFQEHKLQLNDFMEVRIALEPLAVKLAIERGSEAEIREVEEVLLDFERALEQHDAVKLAISDETFHDSIAKATHNRLLIVINEKIADAFAGYRTRSFASAESAEHAKEPHRAILEAIKRRDVAGAQRHVRRHLEISLADIEKVSGESGANRHSTT
jgi:GntR family transcriptional repressor for pyruvate dehydrogenase complex